MSWMAIKSNFSLPIFRISSDVKLAKPGTLSRNACNRMEVLQSHFIGPTSCELLHGTDEQSVFYVAGLLA